MFKVGDKVKFYKYSYNESQKKHIYEPCLNKIGTIVAPVIATSNDHEYIQVNFGDSLIRFIYVDSLKLINNEE